MRPATKAARTAAQLREAVNEVALVAVCRSDADMGAVLALCQRDGRRSPPYDSISRGRITSQWPLRSFLELGALAGAVPSARLHTRHVLWEWGLTAFGDNTELVVSELVTNGVQASRAMAHAAIRLWLVSDREQVAVLVWDACPNPPARIDADNDAEHGRGLLLVEALSTKWDWFPGHGVSASGAGPSGKVVWAMVSGANPEINRQS